MIAFGRSKHVADTICSGVVASSEFLVIEKYRHVPQLEKAAEFNAALMKFLGGNVASK